MSDVLEKQRTLFFLPFDNALREEEEVSIFKLIELGLRHFFS